MLRRQRRDQPREAERRSSAPLAARCCRIRWSIISPMPFRPEPPEAMRVPPLAGKLVSIAALGFALRVAARSYSGEADFWANGYGFFFELAHNIAAGNGLAFDGGTPTAYRVPLYPLFLSAVTLGQQAFVSVLLWQSLIGAG